MAQLVDEGARVVLCTCSTLGRAAEATTAPRASVLRVDRPMAARAVELGRPLLLVAATPTAMTTAVALLRKVGAPPARELLCSDAWRSFEAGDQVGYATAIAQQVNTHAHPNEVAILAQASMAHAAPLIRGADVEVLTSPRWRCEPRHRCCVEPRNCRTLETAMKSAASFRDLGHWRFEVHAHE